MGQNQSQEGSARGSHRPVKLSNEDLDDLRAIEERFHALIRERCGDLTKGLELPKLDASTVMPPDVQTYFPVPGFYGGFSYSIQRGNDNHLEMVTESWCRVYGGSGQRHIITPQKTTLVEEGFV